jgi:4-hydroxy-2-oxoheptanedioate aldolase
MATLVNPARKRLEAGEVSLGLGIRMARGVEIAKIMKTADYDWLFLDMEHGTMTLDATCQIATAALDAGIAPLVRVPAGEYGMATRALDGGALGIVMPHIDTADEARELVDKLCYAPIGSRSPGGPSAHFDFKPIPVGEANKAMNAACLVVAMVETEKAIANADAIAAVPGVDVVMIGTNDLATEMGIPGEFGNPRILAAYETVLAACRKHNKFPGMGGVGAEPLLEKFVKMGMRFILAGGDVGMLIQASAQRSKFLRSCK